MKLLIAKSGALKGKSYTLDERLVIGRGHGCDVVIKSDGASRKHAVLLVREDGSVVLRDLASRNGTRIDDMRVRQAYLKPGDRFSVGDVEFEFRAMEMGGMEPVSAEKSLRTTTGVSDRTTTDEGGSPDRRRELLALAKSLKEKKS